MERFFTQRGISFEARDIQKQHRWYREWHDHFHGDIVPLIVFDNGNRVIDGFDPAAITKALEETGRYPAKKRQP